MAAPPCRRAAPPVLPFELVEEILLRLPPDDPACLLRASVVCEAWGCAVSHPSFRRRLHELHGTPPVLGFLHDSPDDRIPDFVPTTASAFSLAAPDRRFWRALDCRHGRAVFVSEDPRREWDAIELLMWEPATGAQQRVPVPAAFENKNAMMYPSAAVFCAADGCDHHGCHGGPFRVLFVFTVDATTDEEDLYFTSACAYSSETGTWVELTTISCDFGMDFGEIPCLLVGRSLVYFMSNGRGSILEYDFARNELTTFHTPVFEDRFTLMLEEDGGLRLIQDMDSSLKVWSMDASDCTSPRWVLSRVINLNNLLPIDALVNATCSLVVLGFAEGANVILVDTVVGLFTIELLSERVRKVCRKNIFDNQLIPVVDFYTPVSRNEHQDIPLSNANEEERGEEEETVDQAQQLFSNGSNAIKEPSSSTHSNVSAMSSDDLDQRAGGTLQREEEKTVDQGQQLFDIGSNAIKEETSSMCSNVSAMSSDLVDSIPPYGNVPPDTHGCGFAIRSSKLTDPSGDVSQDCTNE